MIQTAAAYGLAELGDEASIPLIIAACEKAPKEVSSLMAESLIYFDNNTAQKAADKFVAPGTQAYSRAEGQRTKAEAPYRTTLRFNDRGTSVEIIGADAILS